MFNNICREKGYYWGGAFSDNWLLLRLVGALVCTNYHYQVSRVLGLIDFFEILCRYLPRILKKITKVNVAKWSRKIFFLSNIWKNATFIENNFFSKMARLWTFFPNRKGFQLFVYFFSKKKIFSLKDYPNSF